MSKSDLPTTAPPCFACDSFALQHYPVKCPTHYYPRPSYRTQLLASCTRRKCLPLRSKPQHEQRAANP
ncbi:hypothetical protein, partial [Escherichia coli]|uniref:hypothetical protein n=1 Tax=Escherichia coli TaxID=562 RepID=UPI001BB127ED